MLTHDPLDHSITQNEKNHQAKKESANEKKTPYILRVKHNRENPYVMLNKQAIWDENLSLDTIGLWTRLMTRPDNWHIHSCELMKSCNVGRDKVRRMLNELVKNGYAYRALERSNGKRQNLFAGYTWYVFEFKMSPEEIEKMFPKTPFPSPEVPAPEDPHLLNKDHSIDILNNEIYTPSDDGREKPSSSNKQKKVVKFEIALKERLPNHPQSKSFTDSFQKPLIGLSDDQHQELVKKHGEVKTQKCYEHLAQWKLSKAESSPKEVKAHTDFYRIRNWVIDAIDVTKVGGGSGYKRSGKLAIDADRTAMERLQETGFEYLDPAELGKQILAAHPDIKATCERNTVKV